MNTHRIVRGLAVLLVLTAAAVTLAPAAQADHGNGRVRYKGYAPGFRGPRVVRVVDRRPVFVEHHSGVGPAVAGFLGGLVLGSLLSNAQPVAPPPPVYEYYDPYCRETFPSFDSYERHLDRYDHPAVLQVIEIHSGRLVDTYEWQDGRWISQRDDRYGDDRYRDDRGRGDDGQGYDER